MKKYCHPKCAKDVGLLALRISVGLIFLVQGWGKLNGIEGVSGMLESNGFPLPMLFAYTLAITEFIGGIAVLLGVFTQFFAGLLAFIMLVALLTVHMGQPLKGSFLPIVLLGANLALWGVGGGKYRLFSSKSECACEVKSEAKA